MDLIPCPKQLFCFESGDSILPHFIHFVMPLRWCHLSFQHPLFCFLSYRLFMFCSILIVIILVFHSFLFIMSLGRWRNQRMNDAQSISTSDVQAPKRTQVYVEWRAASRISQYDRRSEPRPVFHQEYSSFYLAYLLCSSLLDPILSCLIAG